MGDPLQELEERLGNLVPRGLSDEAQVRIDRQIDELAAEVEAPAQGGSRWRWTLGAAAALAAMAGVASFGNFGKEPGAGAGANSPSTLSSTASDPLPNTSAHVDFEMVDYNRTVGDGKDGGIVLGRFNEPMRAWNFEVREMELLLDAESGLKVQIVREGREQVRVAVTSF